MPENAQFPVSPGANSLSLAGKLRELTVARRLLLTVAVIAVLALTLAFGPSRHSSFSALFNPVSNWLADNGDDSVDDQLQLAANRALGDRKGTVIIMDPHTGRIRAVVNSKLAFEESFRPGSTLKPLTTLAALETGIIDANSESVCHEKFAHDEFHTTCSHPRDLPPLNPTEAIAYSCNYYFGKVGERINEASVNSTLEEFGFGRKSGINRNAESAGRLLRSAWRPQSVMGEGDYLQTTPLQLINAYATLFNGGHRFTPLAARARGFTPSLQTEISINKAHRGLILNGMRGSVRYGSAEGAGLYSLPLHTFGKTGTSTEINGFRMQGWFVGFASTPNEDANQKTGGHPEPEKIDLVVLVFLSRGHGAEAAEVARPILAAYASIAGRPTSIEMQKGNGSTGELVISSQVSLPSSVGRNTASSSVVRVHLVRENITQVMPVEDYVRGVVAAEGSTETEPEALKALAIASRTYAIKNLNRHKRDGYDFCTTTHCQRYWRADSDSTSNAALAAVEKTSGEVLRGVDSQVADSYFSASCGGATANFTSLWGGNSPPHLRGVTDDYCSGEAHANWTDKISSADLLKALQSDARTNVGKRLDGIRILRTDQSGRAELLALDGDRRLTIKGWDFKIIVGRVLGWHLLKSSRFTLQRTGSNFVFRGSGFGHGLGLCQEGAHVMAKRGAGYRQILDRYFPGTQVAIGGLRTSADLLWNESQRLKSNFVPASSSASRPATRRTLAAEGFKVVYPSTVDQREIEAVLNLLQSSRRSLLARANAAGISVQFPALEIFVNETTGDFVGRTRQPPWVAAATLRHRIEIQPLAILKRRGILETTLRHELVHVLVDAVGGKQTPRWLAEGLALHYADEGRLIAQYEPRKRIGIEELELRLAGAKSPAHMKAAYASAYREVKDLISTEGEAGVWRRVAR